MIEANAPTTKTLRPSINDSVNWEETKNLYIKGDNLTVLKILQESYLDSIDVIYIDPPYNTGSDSFAYSDNYRLSDEEYETLLKNKDENNNVLFRENNRSNPKFHSDWCSMIYSRLLLARNVLNKNGVIFISIDDNELSNILKICDELFGSSNYLGCITWVKKTKPINSGSAKYQLQSRLEYIVTYCKRKNSENTHMFKLTTKGERKYDVKTDKGYCRLKDIEDSDHGEKARDTMKFQILGIYPPPGKRWKIGFDEIQRLMSEDKVCIINEKIKIKVYPEDENSEIMNPFWSHLPESIGTAETGKKELNEIMSANMGFDTVKPVGLIQELLKHFDNDITVMDFFSGSNTTAHSVMKQNSEDGGTRRFISVQYEELFDVKNDAYGYGYKTICDLGIERTRRAGKITKAKDFGFRTFYVDSSNMKDVYFSPKEYTQSTIDGNIDNIKDDRSDEDLITSIILDWGLKLSLNQKTISIDNKKVHIIDDSALIACFEKNISEQVIRSIAEMKPDYAVFRDQSFTSSSNRINLEEIFKSKSPETVVKVI